MEDRRAVPVVGVDVASATRLAALLERRPRFAERVFTEAERHECAGRPERWASRWAAKEAVRKLFGAGGGAPLPAFRDIEVRSGPGGAPRVTVRGRQPPGVALSLTHEGDVAVAVAVGGTVPETSPEPPPGLRLPDRPDDGHKGTFGTVVVLAGAHGYSGAAYLSAMGAARGGAGLVRLCVPQTLHPIVAVKCTEVMAHGLPDDDEAGVIGPHALEVLRRDHLPAADVLVVGPGLGRAGITERAVKTLLESLTCPTVVDADGLNIAAAHGVDWRRSGQPVVITPHPAEMARLAGSDTRAVQARRVQTASEYAASAGVVVVLKGAETVVAAPDGRVHVDGHRVVALATGGTGDVLAGLCGAMLAGHLEPFDAAVAAVTVHAEAGAAAQAERGRAGVLAGDVLDRLPEAQERLRRALEAAR
ncbi:MAG: NAD(P)H-hydrate dehydratase [Chloroflexi bacterium]|nr:MAG: NAD(P)H-hydrate dehydratase [Chloroflexota bacterium]